MIFPVHLLKCPSQFRNSAGNEVRKIGQSSIELPLGHLFIAGFTSHEKCIPSKAYDYIGAGIPVLAGPRGELSQIVDQFKIGTTFEKISAKEIADSILALKKDEESWSKMCANVKKYRMNFGRRKIAREFFSQGLFNQ